MMPLGSVLDCGTWFSLIEEQLYGARAHGLVPRRLPLECGPIGRHMPQLHQTRLARDTQDLHEHVAKGHQMQLAQ